MSNCGTKLRIEVTPVKMPSTTKLTDHAEAPTLVRKVAKPSFSAAKPAQLVMRETCQLVLLLRNRQVT
jgi:hypothetical protein